MKLETPIRAPGWRSGGFARLGRWSLLAAFVLVGSTCQAHGLAIFLSTPFTPPEGYETYRILSFVGFSLLSALLFWKGWGMQGAAPWLAGPYSVFLFYQVFSLFGYLASSADTSPPPGLGPPSQAFPGLSWGDVGPEFLYWNGLGLAGLICLSLLVGLTWRGLEERRFPALPLMVALPLVLVGFTRFIDFQGPEKLLILSVIIVAGVYLTQGRNARITYLLAWAVVILYAGENARVGIWAMFPLLLLFLFPVASFAGLTLAWPERRTVLATTLVFLFGFGAALTPLIANRALSHGWGGAYFTNSCEDRLSLFARLLKKFADANGGKLPRSRTMEDLTKALLPLLEDERIWPFPDRPGACPRTVPTSREPRPYVWIASCAELPLEDLTSLPIRCEEHPMDEVRESMVLEEIGILPGISRETKRRFEEARRQAEGGDAADQCRLGRMFLQQEGVPRNEKEALAWFRKAAAQGDVEAHFFLGRMFSFGMGVNPDYREAERLYLFAAERGHAEAQAELCCMYESGTGISQDLPRAYMWADAADRPRLAAQMTPAQLEEGTRLLSQRKKENGE